MPTQFTVYVNMTIWGLCHQEKEIILLFISEIFWKFSTKAIDKSTTLISNQDLIEPLLLKVFTCYVNQS